MTDELATVRQAAARISRGQADLYLAIRHAAAAGHSLRNIAAAANTSHQTIANILRSKP